MSLLAIKQYLSEHGITKYLYEWKYNRKENKINRMTDEEYACWKYNLRTGKELNLENPQSYDERIWYLKINVRDPLQKKCTDKYRVREYVEECGLSHILNELYGVYDSVEEIDFDKLPDRCFLKCNHRSGENMIFDRSKPFDYEKFQKKFSESLKTDYYWAGREWNYHNIAPKIICEKVLEDKNGKLPLDYKIMCFAGEPKLLFLDIGVATKEGDHAEEYYRNIYDLDFNLLPVKETRENYLGPEIVKPENWDKMVEYARILSKPFRHCRIDLYNVDGKIYFGEITFHHGGGCNDIQPEEWAIKMGQWIPID
ncbi:MAG: ATP-grasp fold amidoligase family protein [Lachnospiraceae bacterium]|nr:ATP-grasp fold amidoligase family protein [Lachnospiraceae bacterium]